MTTHRYEKALSKCPKSKKHSFLRVSPEEAKAIREQINFTSLIWKCKHCERVIESM